MGNLKQTEEAYHGQSMSKECEKEKVMPERDRMGLVQALSILHESREVQRSLGRDNEFSEALDTIFEWIDNMVILLNKFGGEHDDQD